MDERDQRRDSLMSLDRMTKRKIVPHIVSIPAPVPQPRDVPRLLEVGNYPLHRAFGDPDEGRNVSHARFGLLGDAQEDVRVVGEKRPSGLRFRLRASWTFARRSGFAALASYSH
jgi:hypothetical protein